jgi:hypothetical protein
MKTTILSLAAVLLLSVSGYTQTVPSYVPTSGLVGWWPFNGNAADESGNGNNGTVNGATLTADRFGNQNAAYSFDGVNDFIGASAISFPLSASDRSINFWVSDQSTTNTCNIPVRYGSHSPSNGFWVNVNYNCNANYPNGAIIADFYNVFLVSNNVIPLNQWKMVTITINSQTCSIYIDGQLDNSGPIGINTTLSDTSFYIGADLISTPNYYYNGLIDDIGIWNRALTQQEITALYQTQQPQCLPAYVPTSGLVGWWPFCGNAVDESGNGNNGTVNGATLTTDRFGSASQAYIFDGINDYIIANSNNIPTNTAISISVWINPYQNNGIAEYICLGSPSNTAWGTLAGTNWNGSPHQTMNYGRGCSGTGTSNVAISPFLNVWQNITYVSSGVGGICQVYVNGTFIGQSSNGTTGGCSNSNLYFGVDIFGPNYINCKLDDIGIWNRALTQQEVTNLYNASMTSIAEVGNSPSFSIYPNPASDNISINADASLLGTNYIIYDAVGRVVCSGTVATSTMSISLNGLSSGLYTLVINEQYRKSFTVAK